MSFELWSSPLAVPPPTPQTAPPTSPLVPQSPETQELIRLLQEGREDTGCSPSPSINSLPTSRQDATGSEGNWNLEVVKVAICTGKYVLDLQGRVHLPTLENCLEMCMANLRTQNPLSNTFGKRLLESMEPNSKSAHFLLKEAIQRTGIRSGVMQWQGKSWQFLPTYEYVVIVQSEELAKTIWNVLQCSELVMFSGGQVDQVKVVGRGKRPVYQLMLKTPVVNSGVVTEVRRIVCLMNLGVASTSLTCSGGWIGTRVTLRLKEEADPSMSELIGLLAMSIPRDGIQISTSQPLMLSYGGW